MCVKRAAIEKGRSERLAANKRLQNPCDLKIEHTALFNLEGETR
jgi:hypothetical protein